MNTVKLAKVVAAKYLSKLAYEASGDIEKVMGEILTGELGITDAPEEFFTVAQGKLMDRLDEEGMDIDLEDPDMYPVIRQAIMETLDELGIEPGDQDPEVDIE